MLFAQETGTIITVVGMVLASLGASVAALFSWLSARDKLRYDAKIIKLESDISNIQKDILECNNEKEKLRERIEKIEQERQQESKELRERIEKRQ